MKTTQSDSEAKAVLQRLIREFNNAHTLYYEGNKTHPQWVAGQATGHRNDMDIVTHQKYYLKNESGMTSIRAESSAAVHGRSMTTVFIKNEDGIWEVLTDQVCEVSKVFARDQLLGVFPFFRLFSCLQHPYELHLSEESHRGAECFVIDGRVPDALGATGPDIAKEFTYMIGKRDGRLYSIHERTFALKCLDLELDKLELNRALDSALFDLPDKPKIILSSLDQFVELRNQEMMKRLNAPSV